MPTPPPVIFWFRNDLRLADNQALERAVATGRPLLTVYVLDETTPGVRPAGGAGRWWLHGSLERLAEAIRGKGGRLLLTKGSAASRLEQLARETGATDIFYSRGYDPGARRQEQDLRTYLADAVELHCYGGRLLYEPENVSTRQGHPFKVFTPFWRACQTLPQPAIPLPAPGRLKGHMPGPAGDRLDDWQLRPRTPDWAAGLRSHWKPGEDAAASRLDEFMATAASAYPTARDRPDQPGTSALSPCLAHGEISARQIWHTATAQAVRNPASGPGIEAFLRQLFWREFSTHLLFHWPQMATRPLRGEFERFPWRDAPAELKRWQQGLTGYPIVDAGMRQLRKTGWMHNRVRMIAASFLVKDLLIPWQAGEAWFWDNLVDADLANNAASWQWVAGSGTDSAPYFRIFNPLTQAMKHDPQGRYVRHWLPELSSLPGASAHAPWNAGPDLSGTGYPSPIVEHVPARERALAAYRHMREG